jgi:glycosyltransferase involved in cell wall biosynthesis
MSNLCPVSVIVPIYGHLKTLERALISIELQSYLPLEVLIISDGNSTLLNIQIEEVVSKFSKVIFRIINLPINIGAGGARNAGWGIAKGEFVAFLDADDVWHPRKLELQYQFMYQNPWVQCSGHEFIFINDRDFKWGKYSGHVNHRLISFPRLLLMNPFITPSIMIRSSCSYRFAKNQRFSEDYRLWLEISAAGLPVAKINLKLAGIYKPLISPSGLSSRLIDMEIGEIRAYWAASSSRIYRLPLILILAPYSLIKFIRRVAIRVINFKS